MEEQQQNLLNELLLTAMTTRGIDIQTVNVLLDKGADPKYLNHSDKKIDFYNLIFDSKDIEKFIIRLFDGGFSRTDDKIIQFLTEFGLTDALLRSLDLVYERIEKNALIYLISTEEKFSSYMLDKVIPNVFGRPELLDKILDKFNISTTKVFNLLYKTYLKNVDKASLYQLLCKRFYYRSETLEKYAFENKDYEILYIVYNDNKGGKENEILDYVFGTKNLKFLKYLNECNYVIEAVINGFLEKYDLTKHSINMYPHDDVYPLIEYLLSEDLIQSDKAIDNVMFLAIRIDHVKLLKRLLDKRFGVKTKTEDYEIIEHVQKHGSLPPGVKIISNENENSDSET